jgi:hypothetical protein
MSVTRVSALHGFSEATSLAGDNFDPVRDHAHSDSQGHPINCEAKEQS